MVLCTIFHKVFLLAWWRLQQTGWEQCVLIIGRELWRRSVHSRDRVVVKRLVEVPVRVRPKHGQALISME
jgi:hypothetical protein